MKVSALVQDVGFERAVSRRCWFRLPRRARWAPLSLKPTELGKWERRGRASSDGKAFCSESRQYILQPISGRLG